MYAARYFPGLQLTVDQVGAMSPEQTSALRKTGDKILKREAEERLMHTKALIRSGRR